jgi:bacterial/archaeal transporter family-2 protein
VDKVLVATLATVFAGGAIAIQAPLNSELGGSVGTFAAASVNFAVGTALLLCVTVVFGGGFGDLSDAKELPWYYVFGGGLLGAMYVTVALLTVRSLGAGGVTAATLAGQLAASVAIDRAGALGLPERDITVGRMAGVALLAVGTYLMVR